MAAVRSWLVCIKILFMTKNTNLPTYIRWKYNSYLPVNFTINVVLERNTIKTFYIKIGWTIVPCLGAEAKVAQPCELGEVLCIDSKRL